MTTASTRGVRWLLTSSLCFALLCLDGHKADLAPCGGEGWRPLWNASFPIDLAPPHMRYKKPVAFPTCTNYVKWSIPEDLRDFAETALCEIVPFEQLRQHKLGASLNCSSWERGEGLALDESKFQADVSRFASVLYQCEEQEGLRYFSRSLVTNICPTSHRPQVGSLVVGCSSAGPNLGFKWGYAVLTDVKFVRSDPAKNSCIGPSHNHTRMTMMAWTGVTGDVASGSGKAYSATRPPVPTRQCVWRQQNFGDPGASSVEVTWQHGTPESPFHDSDVCPAEEIRPLLVVAGDAHTGVHGNPWHTWHNVIYLTFSALHDSGLLTCDEVTGACSVSSSFDILSILKHTVSPGLCDIFKRLLGHEGWCSYSARRFRDTCYRRVIFQASSSSNAHIYSSGNGTVLRLFARAVENVYRLTPLTPTEVKLRPAHVVFLERFKRRPGFDEESLHNLDVVMQEAGIPFTKVACSHANKTSDIAAIRSATVLIGATGAAFTNTWHLTPGAVVVLATTGSPWFETWYFKALALNTGSTFIRWTPSQQNYSDPHFGLTTMYPTQSQATWRTVIRTALLQQDSQAQSHPRVVDFMKERARDTAPQDRRCDALLMVYKPRQLASSSKAERSIEV